MDGGRLGPIGLNRISDVHPGAVTDILGGDIRPPVGHARLFGGDEPDIAVDAAAGIPAGTLRLVVQPDLDSIGPRPEPGVQFHRPGSITIGPGTGFLSVHIDFRIGERPVHFQADVFVQAFHLQDLAVGSLPPPGQLTGFAGVLLHKRLLHPPVVRKVQRTGLPVFGKGPAIIPQNTSERLRAPVIRQCRQGGQ